MLVSDILKAKGSAVKSVRSTDSTMSLAQRLQTEQVGAMVVSDSGGLDGIVTERDLAYGLSRHGAKLPAMHVSDIMTKTVVTCSPRDTVSQMMSVMTQRRVRHLPVKDGDKLVGVISIGDVLKSRLGEMELEANVLRDYAIARR